MKRQKGGTVSKEQKDWHEYLPLIGDTVFGVQREFENAKEKYQKILQIIVDIPPDCIIIIYMR